MPNASFIGFTGTPIEKADANTRAVFGDYISTTQEVIEEPIKLAKELDAATRRGEDLGLTEAELLCADWAA